MRKITITLDLDTERLLRVIAMERGTSKANLAKKDFNRRDKKNSTQQRFIKNTNNLKNFKKVIDKQKTVYYNINK